MQKLTTIVPWPLPQYDSFLKQQQQQQQQQEEGATCHEPFIQTCRKDDMARAKITMQRAKC